MKNACELLERYFMGSLSEAEETAFQEHLQSCPACQQRLQGLRALRTAFEYEERRPTWRRLGRFVVNSRWARVAALVVLVSTLGLGYYVWTRPQPATINPGLVHEVVWSVDTLKQDSVSQKPAQPVP